MNNEVSGEYSIHGRRPAEFRLIHGDCMEVMPLLPDRDMDLILTDVPFAEVNRPSAGIRNFDKGFADEPTFALRDFVRECIGVLGGSIYVFCGSRQLSLILDEFADRDLVQVRFCVWHKSNPSPVNGENGWLSALELCAYAKRPGAVFNEHCQHNVWSYRTLKDKVHPTEKPLDLLTRLIEASSQAGALVFDPCMGSGATGEAALRAGRDFIGIELDEEAFHVAAQRLQHLESHGP